jgi:hypothetical protein
LVRLYYTRVSYFQRDGDRGRIRINNRNVGNKAIPETGQSLDKAWLYGGITKDLAYLVDGGPQTVIKVDKSVGGPKFLAYLLSRH